MEENGLLAPHRVGRNQEKTHDGTIVTDKVNEMWGTDMSQTVTLEEGRAYRDQARLGFARRRSFVVLRADDRAQLGRDRPRHIPAARYRSSVHRRRWRAVGGTCVGAQQRASPASSQSGRSHPSSHQPSRRSKNVSRTGFRIHQPWARGFKTWSRRPPSQVLADCGTKPGLPLRARPSLARRLRVIPTALTVKSR